MWYEIPGELHGKYITGKFYTLIRMDIWLALITCYTFSVELFSELLRNVLLILFISSLIRYLKQHSVRRLDIRAGSASNKFCINQDQQIYVMDDG